MKPTFLRPLVPFALSLSLSLALAACSPQPVQLQVPARSGALTPAFVSAAPQGRESLSFRFPRPAGFRTLLAEPDRLAFISMSLTGDGIEGTRSNQGGLIPVSGEATTLTISDLPIQPDKLRVVTLTGYDAERNPLPSFVAKGFYHSRTGVDRISLELNRRQWLAGRALELLLASNPAAASAVDLVALQAAIDEAIGFSEGSFSTDPTLFNPAALATLLAGGEVPPAATITSSARLNPGQLLFELATARGGDFGENLTVVVNDPNSVAATVASGSASPQSPELAVTPGSWTLEVRRADGTVLASRSITVDSDGLVSTGSEPLTLSEVIETPVISSLSSASGAVGQTLTLTGKGFSATALENSVHFGETLEGSVTGTPSNTSLEVTIPAASLGEHTLTVTVAGQTSSGQSFTIVPGLTGSTAEAGIGDTITLSGSHFSTTAADNTVTFSGAEGDIPGTVTGTPTSDSLEVIVPEGISGAQSVTVTVAELQSAERSFAVVPKLASRSPANGGAGTTVTLTGSGFAASGTTVSFGSTAGSIVGTPSNTSLSVTAPGGLTDSHDITVSVNGKTSNALSYSFTVGEIRVNTTTGNLQSLPATAIDADGDFVVVWASNSQDGSGYGVYGQRYSSTGVALGSEFLVNTAAANNQTLPAVAMDADGDFVVTWQSNLGQDGSGEGIYAQRYSSTGAVLGSEFRVNSFTTGDQSLPAVACESNGDFVIVWTSFQGGSNREIYLQRYSSAGAAIDSELRVNTHTTNYQNLPAVAMDADGDFAVVWASNLQDGSYYGIYAQRYTSAGAAAGSEFQVNDETSNRQNQPSIAMDSDGDFVVTWQSNYQDGSNFGVYAKPYTSDGSTASSEFRVNTRTASFQTIPTAAMDASGSFLISWQSFSQDGSGYGIYGQRYDSSGTPAGSEFSHNSFTTGYQTVAATAMDADGDFVVFWSSNGQDGSSDGVYGKLYTSSGQEK